MSALDGNTLFSVHIEASTYYLGRLGAFTAIHVQCAMGSASQNGALTTAIEAIREWKPRYLVMVGIAFGVDKRKQKIGDVLVSASAIPYDIKRVGKNGNIYRSPHPAASVTLIDRFRSCVNLAVDQEGKKIPVNVGPLLTGESLMDNNEELQKLKDDFPQAIGGDMEGAGISAAAARSNTEWIIIKSICDFADGNKARNKKRNQEKAARNAAALCKCVFSSQDRFPELIGSSPVDSPQTRYLLNEVLFDLYSTEVESFYRIRVEDNVLESSFPAYSLWCYGQSGTGKTSMIRRLLLKGKVPYFYVDLSPCVGLGVESFFSEILYTLGSPPRADGVPNLIRQIADTLSASEKKVVFIDEVPLGQGVIAQDFIDSMYALLNVLRNQGQMQDSCFLISSLFAPDPTITQYHEKLREFVRFVDINIWTDQEIKGLYLQLRPFLPLPLDENEEINLVTHSKGIPRVLKQLLRDRIHISTLGK